MISASATSSTTNRRVPDARRAVRVCVAAPARLHLGFFDPNASLGRAFGSLGLTLDAPVTQVEIGSADDDRVDAPPEAARETQRARAHIARLKQLTGKHDALAVRLERVLPAHAGLGSGTQLALSLGRAFAELHGIEISTTELAGGLDRGKRSGVGVAGFDRGGLLVDGGRRADGAVAPLLARLDFPSAWRVLLLIDPRARGLHGEAERAALAALPALSEVAAAHLCHLVLMRVLPAVAEADFAPFADGINRMQRAIGAYFAPVQRGRIYLSAEVESTLEWMQANEGAGVGQSSWGPTGFAFLPSMEAAQRALARAQSAGVVDQALQPMIVSAQNSGATTLRK